MPPIAIGQPIRHSQLAHEGHKAKSLTWTDFQKKYLNREDGCKYEWVDGAVVKSTNMDYTHLYIVKNLLVLFRNLILHNKVAGELLSEGDFFFGANHRRPDISYLTDEQITRASYGENQTPAFVMEIISTKDQANLVQLKLKNYRDAGVKVVWLIFPLLEQVHVYHGATLKRMSVCEGEDKCSAAPVIPDFELRATDVFFKNPMP